MYKTIDDIVLNNRKRKRTASEKALAKASYEIQGLTYRQLIPFTVTACFNVLVSKIKSVIK